MTAESSPLAGPPIMTAGDDASRSPPNDPASYTRLNYGGILNACYASSIDLVESDGNETGKPPPSDGDPPTDGKAKFSAAFAIQVIIWIVSIVILTV